MIEATVIENYRHTTVIACTGLEFVKYEYRSVPAEFEAEAERNPFLKTRKIRDVKPVRKTTKKAEVMEDEILEVPAEEELVEED